ncbi:hypothetical protein ACFL6S_24300, partial [Candidatus Poribacteria bacterium]
ERAWLVAAAWFRYGLRPTQPALTIHNTENQKALSLLWVSWAMSFYIIDGSVGQRKLDLLVGI